MPEQRSPKARLHPLRQALPASAPSAAWGPRDSYAELEVSSNFTFLTGASHPDEYMARAAELGYRALAITDTNTLAGIVRAHVAARDVDLQLVVGARLRLSDVPDM
ncbi:MAG: PHP domain-containing protein, partial [Phycisphaerae bacterium]|nr:PHP domain-containing protein [Phycisphaerae bacterium]